MVEIRNNRQVALHLEAKIIEELEPGKEELSFIHAGESFSEIFVAPLMQENLAFLLIPVACGYHALPRVKFESKSELISNNEGELPTTLPNLSPFAAVFVNP